MAYRNHPRVIRISGTGPYGVDGTYEFITEMPENAAYICRRVTSYPRWLHRLRYYALRLLGSRGMPLEAISYAHMSEAVTIEEAWTEHATMVDGRLVWPGKWGTK